ncbi:MAG: hypothetical protein HC882_00155 [Acidobacteria bacterium]|nr:hypothetical protein [Acidobacteriota bacterium]
MIFDPSIIWALDDRALDDAQSWRAALAGPLKPLIAVVRSEEDAISAASAFNTVEFHARVRDASLEPRERGTHLRLVFLSHEGVDADTRNMVERGIVTSRISREVQAVEFHRVLVIESAPGLEGDPRPRFTHIMGRPWLLSDRTDDLLRLSTGDVAEYLDALLSLLLLTPRGSEWESLPQFKQLLGLDQADSNLVRTLGLPRADVRRLLRRVSEACLRAALRDWRAQQRGGGTKGGDLQRRVRSCFSELLDGKGRPRSFLETAFGSVETQSLEFIALAGGDFYEVEAEHLKYQMGALRSKEGRQVRRIVDGEVQSLNLLQRIVAFLARLVGLQVGGAIGQLQEESYEIEIQEVEVLVESLQAASIACRGWQTYLSEVESEALVIPSDLAEEILKSARAEAAALMRAFSGKSGGALRRFETDVLPALLDRVEALVVPRLFDARGWSGLDGTLAGSLANLAGGGNYRFAVAQRAAESVHAEHIVHDRSGRTAAGILSKKSPIWWDLPFADKRRGRMMAVSEALPIERLVW